jgi:starch-binding outer membrane protein, SusD/RagB family
MIMKKIKWIYTSLLFTGIILSGCKKVTDIKPQDSTYNEVFWNSGTNVQKAVAGTYGLFRTAIRQDVCFFTFGDLPTDEFTLGSGFWNYTSFVPSGNHQYSYAPYLESSLWNWSNFYKVINQCHLVLENAPAIPDSKFSGSKTKNQLLGEAMFMRAYTYFYMTRVWGDVILTTESLKDPLNVPQLGRSKEADVLNYCINDLKNAASLLDFSAEKSEASKGAVWALLAHIYAWNHDYTTASKYCDSVILSNQYALEPVDNYLNIWKGNSQESIFELNMKYDALNNEATDYFFGRFLHDPMIKGKESKDSWQINTNVAFGELFDISVDMRALQIIDDVNSSEPSLLKYAGVNYYDPNDPKVYVVSNNLVLLRLADIYLLKSESLFKNGDMAGALDALNVVKNRAGLESSTSADEALWDEILEERRRELIGEGCNAYDFIRMGKLNEYFSSFPPERIEKKGYYWPLDMRTLLPQAPLLTQNEWWKNH